MKDAASLADFGKARAYSTGMRAAAHQPTSRLETEVSDGQSLTHPTAQPLCVQMRVEERYGFGPRIGGGTGVVNRTGVVVEAVGGSLIEVQTHGLPALYQAGNKLGDPAVLVVVCFREDRE